MRMDELRARLSQPEIIAAYRAWLQNPVTRMVLDGAREQVRLRNLSLPPSVEPDAVDAVQKTAMKYCVQWGREEILAFLENLDALVSAPEDELDRDYGAQQYFAEMGMPDRVDTGKKETDDE